MLFAIGLPILIIFLYESYKIKKEGQKQCIHNMDYKQRRIYVVNIIFIVVFIIMILIGVYKNYQFVKTYKQQGEYAQGEILERKTKNRLRGYVYQIKIVQDGETQMVSSWSDDYYDVKTMVGLYYLHEETSQKVMLENEKQCLEGYYLMENSLIFLILAVAIWGWRYELLGLNY